MDSNFDLSNIPLDDKKTWDLLCEGRSRGVFQGESRLCQIYLKRIQPRSIRDLADVISVIRPSCLDALVEGKSLTNHFCDRRSGLEEAIPLHPALEPILRDTHQIMVYQESALKIAKEIAGFSLERAEVLRKAIGKKKVDIMAKLENEFIEGCIRVNKVNDKSAKDIFEMIKSSQRYAFNLSHAVSYALTSYATAYLKSTFPLQFFTSWLNYADEKIDPKQEIEELILDAKTFGIEVQPPSLTRVGNGDFFITGDSSIAFGLKEIKGVGKSKIKKLITAVREAGKLPEQMTWMEILSSILDRVDLTTGTNLIKTGCLSFLGVNRKKLLYEYSIWRKLKEEEKQLRRETLEETLLAAINTEGVNAKRKSTLTDLLSILKNPLHTLEDSFMEIIDDEEELLGIPLTLTRLDGKDLTPNITCKEFLDGGGPRRCIFGVEIKEVKEYTTKRGASAGSPMAFLTIEDKTARMDCVVFSEPYEKYKHYLMKKSVVYLIGNRTAKNSFSVEKVVSA